MKKSLLQSLGLILVLFFVADAYAQVSPSFIVNVDYYNATRYNNNRKIARASDGTLMITWEPDGNPSKEVVYMIYDNSFEAWGEPLQLSTSDKGDTGGPGLVADDAGNIYANWKQYNDKTAEKMKNRRDYMFAKWDGSAWSEPVAVEQDSGNAGFGSMALAPDGTIFVTYTDFGNQYGPQNVHVSWSFDSGATWNHKNVTQKEELFGDYIEPCLTHGPNGTMILAWYDESDPANISATDRYPIKEVLFSVFDGTDWSEPFTVTPTISDGDTLNAYYPTTITDSNNLVHVIYTEEDNYLMHAAWDGTTLSTPVRIDVSADTMAIDRAAVSIDDKDNLYVVWQEQTIKSNVGNVDNAFYAISMDGGQTWSTPVQMSDATTEDGSGHSVERPSIARKIRGPIEGVFEGGADVLWEQNNPESVLGWDMIYYRIPLANSDHVAKQSVNPADVFTLEQNYPNPFNPNTEIRFQLHEAGMVELTIFNNLGHRVKTLVNQKLAAAQHNISWDGTNADGLPVPSGIYFYKLCTGNFTATKRMVFLK